MDGKVWGESLDSTKINKSKFFGNNSGNNNETKYKRNHKDPIEISRQVTNEVLPIAHLLQYTWTIFFHSRKTREVNSEINNNTNIEPTSVDSFLQTTKEIEFPEIYTKDSFNGMIKKTIYISTIEELFESLSILKKTYELPIGTEIFIFKSGIEPVWEDKLNAKGGRWMFKFPRRKFNNNETNLSEEEIKRIRFKTGVIWERLILKILGGSLINKQNLHSELILNDISGLVLSIRKDEDFINIWNTNLCYQKKFQENYYQKIFENNPTMKENPINDYNKDDNKLLFNDRRLLCSSILNIIREVNEILDDHKDISITKEINSNERVNGVSFEYRLHSDNPRDHLNNDKRISNNNRRYNNKPHKFDENHNHNHSSTSPDKIFDNFSELGKRRPKIDGENSKNLMSISSRRRLMKNSNSSEIIEN